MCAQRRARSPSHNLVAATDRLSDLVEHPLYGFTEGDVDVVEGEG